MAVTDDLVLDNEEEIVEEQEAEVEISDEADEPELEDDQEPDQEEESDDDEDEEDRVVTIGDSEPEEVEKPEAPGWVKKVRKVNRKLESENRKLKKMLQERSTESAKPEPIEVGEKPTLKSVGYDDKKYEQALDQWLERKKAAMVQQAEAEKAAQEQQEKWQAKQQAYAKKKEEHSFKDFSIAEEMVSSTLDVTQQGIIVQGAEDSALVVYALGKNPKVLEELASEHDPVQFAFKVAKLESQLKVRDKKAPAPEKRVKGGKAGGMSGGGDATLERLREEAAKTGDYSKVLKYKQKLRERNR